MARKFSQSRAVPRNKIDRNKSSCTLVQSRGLQLQYLLYTWLPIGEDYHELHWITKDYHGLPIFLKDYHVLPRITTHYVGLPRISMENHGLPWILPRCCSVLLLGRGGGSGAHVIENGGWATAAAIFEGLLKVFLSNVRWNNGDADFTYRKDKPSIWRLPQTFTETFKSSAWFLHWKP